MKKVFLFFLLNFMALSVFPQQNSEEKRIRSLLNNWHTTAAEADFDAYFYLMAKNSIFIGTDATGNWGKAEFMACAKPHFDSGKTQMGICRGSGVLKKIEGNWKIAHYVLFISLPNENLAKVTNLKNAFDSKMINSLQTINLNLSPTYLSKYQHA